MERVFAVETVNIGEVFAPAGESGLTSITSIVNIIVKNAFTIAGVIAFFLLIFGGFQFIVSAGSGDSKQMEQSKKTITSAVIGLIVIFASYWIVQIIEVLTGIKLISK